LALDDYRTSKADFADCLIGRRNRAHGSKLTLSFDRRLKGLDTFEVV
jgi:predicted nucleic-acid-binding protein